MKTRPTSERLADTPNPPHNPEVSSPAPRWRQGLALYLVADLAVSAVLGLVAWAHEAKATDGPVEGAAQNHFKLELLTPSPTTKPGQPANVTFRITPQNGFKINPDAPDKSVASVALTLPDGLASPAAKFTGESFKNLRSAPEITLALTPAKAGDYVVSGEFRFLICDKNVCERPTYTQSFKVVAK
jgi:hypothetical protein